MWRLRTQLCTAALRKCRPILALLLLGAQHIAAPLPASTQPARLRCLPAHPCRLLEANRRLSEEANKRKLSEANKRKVLEANR